MQIKLKLTLHKGEINKQTKPPQLISPQRGEIKGDLTVGGIWTLVNGFSEWDLFHDISTNSYYCLEEREGVFPKSFMNWRVFGVVFTLNILHIVDKKHQEKESWLSSMPSSSFQSVNGANWAHGCSRFGTP